MEEEKSNVKQLVDEVQDYIKTRIDLATLTAVDKVSDGVSKAALYITLFLLSFFFLIFASTALALGIGDALENNWLGFLIVAGIYLLLCILIWSMKESWIIRPITDTIVKNFFSKKPESK